MDKLRSELGVIDNANLQGADLMGGKWSIPEAARQSKGTLQCQT
jgi:hypothetical protein